jgi:hypothetical protein
LNVQKDYEDLFGLLNKNKVRYCIVGAYALAFYGAPRFTKDIDIFIEANPDNAQRVLKALEGFGFGKLGLKKKDFEKEGNIIQLGFEPVRIDILTAIDGPNFQEAWKKKRLGKYGRQKVFFIGREELVKNKRASGREQDKIDLKILLTSKRRKR